LAEQQRFMANPDFYAPMLSGHDSVVYIEQGRLVPGTREHGVFYRQQVYLFSSEESLQRFWQGPERFHAAAFQAMRQTLSSQR
jgi:YHS domain-containing protein